MKMSLTPRILADKSDLSTPRGSPSRLSSRYDADAFGKFAETMARTMGTGKFLARELASVRLALADVVTQADLGDRLDHLEKLIIDRLPAG